MLIYYSFLSMFLCSRVIWLGDLNYRIGLSYRTAKALVEMHNWKVLLENDQVTKMKREIKGFCFEFLHAHVN